MNMEPGYGGIYPSAMLGNTNQPAPGPWQPQTRPTSPMMDPARQMCMERPRSPSPYMQHPMVNPPPPQMVNPPPPQMGNPPPPQMVNPPPPQMVNPQMRPHSVSPGRPIVIQQTIEQRPRSPYTQYVPQPVRAPSPIPTRPRSVSPQPMEPQQQVWFHTPHLLDPPGTPPLGRHVFQVDINRGQPPTAPPPDQYAQRYAPQSASMYDRPPQYQQQYMAPPSPPPQRQPQYMAPPSPPPQRQPQYMAPPSPPPQRQPQYMAPPSPPPQRQPQYMPQPQQYAQQPTRSPEVQQMQYQYPPSKRADEMQYAPPPTVQHLPPRYVSTQDLQQNYPAPAQYPPRQHQPLPTCSSCLARAMESQGHGG